ncbi:hypothetical protein OCGS_2465 [Oceaniovalibus guishaninsula JLT2003]|uniref:ATPase n=1 Tax=Oceaniovalibus guishaninsula JLT2003 TaxID=1231392 RepID=K2H9X0_9RHOB|nr:ATP12 family protein [Oceaniovalibus guishaninsula]EKE43427.1 hypothetical protein OCGS_2465 [Oceaniovalibus guishaninsula JLT2003]
MTEWAPKRFWTAARIVRTEDGHAVFLDDRPLRTPAGAPLALPADTLARMVAEEWDAQTERVDPLTMPATRSANSAIDKVTPQRAAVVAALLEYGATDLLCYRADGPPTLVARQAAAWDPLLDWAAATFGARLRTTVGVMPVAQDAADIARLSPPVEAMDPFALAGFYDLVSLTGSLVLALAVSARHLDPETAWDASRIDETWQSEQWGVDDEAARQVAIRRQAFMDAARFHYAAS